MEFSMGVSENWRKKIITVLKSFSNNIWECHHAESCKAVILSYNQIKSYVCLLKDISDNSNENHQAVLYHYYLNFFKNRV